MKTLTPTTFTVTVCQATVFTPDQDTKVGRVMSQLPRWLARFDADPVVANTGDGQPRVVLSDTARTWRAEVTAARADVYWVLAAPQGTPPRPGAFYPAAADLLVELVTIARVRVGRLAAVITRLAPHDTPGAYLAAHYCQPRWNAEPPDRFELALHHRSVLGGHEVNAWTRCLTAPGPDPAVMGAVHVEQDLNTPVETLATRRFSTEDIAAWLACVPAEMDAMLERHFPAAGAGP